MPQFFPAYALIAFGASIVSLTRGGHSSGADRAYLLTLLGTLVVGTTVFFIANTMPDMRGLAIIIVHVYASMIALVVAPFGAIACQGVQHKVPAKLWWIVPLVLVVLCDIVMGIMS